MRNRPENRCTICSGCIARRKLNLSTGLTTFSQVSKLSAFKPLKDSFIFFTGKNRVLCCESVPGLYQGPRLGKRYLNRKPCSQFRMPKGTREPGARTPSQTPLADFFCHRTMPSPQSMASASSWRGGGAGKLRNNSLFQALFLALCPTKPRWNRLDFAPLSERNFSVLL